LQHHADTTTDSEGEALLCSEQADEDEAYEEQHAHTRSVVAAAGFGAEEHDHWAQDEGSSDAAGSEEGDGDPESPARLADEGDFECSDDEEDDDDDGSGSDGLGAAGGEQRWYHMHAARFMDMEDSEGPDGREDGDEQLSGDEDAVFGGGAGGGMPWPPVFCLNCTGRMLPSSAAAAPVGSGVMGQSHSQECDGQATVRTDNNDSAQRCGHWCPACGHATARDQQLLTSGVSSTGAATGLVSELLPPPPPQAPVALLWDERMEDHEEGKRHNPHPERPDRVRAVMARLKASGLTGQRQF
jgi:hypothetical protein